MVTGIDQGLADIEKKEIGRVPPHLRDAHYRGASRLGHGQGYLYPHNYPGNYVAQQYLPDTMVGTVYYQPFENGNEVAVKARMNKRQSE